MVLRRRPVDPVAERWAGYAREAVRDSNSSVTVEHDAERGVLRLSTGDELVLAEIAERVGRNTHAQQRGHVQFLVEHALDRRFVVPDDWVTGDRDLDREVRRALLDLQKNPASPRAQERVGRLHQRLGIPGGEERLRWAADRYLAEAIEDDRPGSAQRAGLIWAHLGDDERVRATGEAILTQIRSTAHETDVERVHETHWSSFVLGLLWGRGRAGVASVAHGIGADPELSAPTLVRAAGAAEAGRWNDLADAAAALERMAVTWRRQLGGSNVMDGHGLDHMAAAAGQWAAEAGATTEPPADPPPITGAVAFERSLASVQSLAWRGDAIVATTPTGQVAFTTVGEPAVVPAEPRSAPPPTLEVDDDRVVAVIGDGERIELAHRWSADDELGHVEPENVSVGANGSLIAVWTTHGPGAVFERSGEFVAPVPAPAGDPVFGIEIDATGAAAMRWAWSGPDVYSLPDGVRRGGVQLAGLIEDASIGFGGRLVLAFDQVDDWTCHDVATARIGPTRRAKRAALHPVEPLAAYADERGVWVERYEQ